MPAQWEKYPLKTQQEMMAGHNAIVADRCAHRADEAEKWLREKFTGRDLVFHTAWNTSSKEITLEVFRNTYDGRKNPELIFSVTEPAADFVSHATVTKIIMVM
jgi:hypothetical protein